VQEVVEAAIHLVPRRRGELVVGKPSENLPRRTRRLAQILLDILGDAVEVGVLLDVHCRGSHARKGGLFLVSLRRLLGRKAPRLRDELLGIQELRLRLGETLLQVSLLLRQSGDGLVDVRVGVAARVHQNVREDDEPDEVDGIVGVLVEEGVHREGLVVVVEERLHREGLGVELERHLWSWVVRAAVAARRFNFIEKCVCVCASLLGVHGLVRAERVLLARARAARDEDAEYAVLVADLDAVATRRAEVELLGRSARDALVELVTHAVEHLPAAVLALPDAVDAVRLGRHEGVARRVARALGRHQTVRGVVAEGRPEGVPGLLRHRAPRADVGAHRADAARHARRERHVGVAAQLLQERVGRRLRHARLGAALVQRVAHRLAHAVHRVGARAHVDLLLLPLVGQVGGVVRAARRQHEALLVPVDADGLEPAVALLVVVDALLRLRDGAVLHDVAEVVRGEDAVVAGPLRRARRRLVNHDKDGHARGLAPPVVGRRPLNLLSANLRVLDAHVVALVDDDEAVGELGEGREVAEKLVDGLVLLDVGLLAAQLRVREAEHDNVARGVERHGGAQVAHDVLALRREAEAVRRLVEEGEGLVDEAGREKALGPAVARGRRVRDAVALADHLAHHRLVLLVVDLAREEDLLGRGAVEDVGDAVVVAHDRPDLAQQLLGARAVVALVEVQHDALARHAAQLLAHPLEAVVDGLLAAQREDAHVVRAELVALVLVCRAVPGREEGVHAARVRDRVAHGDVLDHLALATLNGCAQNDAAALWVLQQRNDVLAYEGGEVLALLLEDGDGPGLGGHGHGHLGRGRQRKAEGLAEGLDCLGGKSTYMRGRAFNFIRKLKEGVKTGRGWQRPLWIFIAYFNL